MKRTIPLLMTIIAIMALCNAANAQLGVFKTGAGAGYSNSSGDFNTFVGDSAGYTNTAGHYNTFIGYRAGYSLSFASFTQSDNTIIGAEAMGGTPFSVSSTDNVIIGKMAGYNHYGTDVVIIGTQAGYNNQNGADVVFIGEEAGYSNTEGDDNVFVGEDAGYSNTTASDNTFIGNQAGRTNTTGFRNVFVGNEAGWDNTTGFRNTFVGDSAGVDIGVGHHNTFVGQACGSNTEHADCNTFVGSYAGWDNNRTNETNNANFNTYVGYRTGFTNREGQFNVMIGAHADFSSAAMGGNGATNSYNIGIGYDALIYGERVYSCVIGPNAKVSADNSMVIGGTTSETRMSVGIGTDRPNQNASLDLAENDKGFLISRLTEEEKTTFTSALDASDEGMMVYDKTNKLLYLWNGSQWVSSGIQTLGLNNNNLSLSSGNSVDLSSYLDNTDAQNLYLTGNTLALTNDATTVDLTGFMDNTDGQTLSLSGTDLTITGGNTVNLSSLQDGYEANTDEQDLTLTGNTLALTNDATSVDLTGFLDNTDEQNLSGYLAEKSLHIDIVNGTSAVIDLSSLQDGTGTDDQTIDLTNNVLSIEGANSVDLTKYMDNTDSQNLSGASLNGTTLQIDIDNGNSASVDLSSLQDGSGTDNQALSLTGNDLSITNGNSVDLSAVIEPLQQQINELINRVNTLQNELDACCNSTKVETVNKPSDHGILYQNAPNPWGDNTIIKYYTPNTCNKASIEIRSINGKLLNKFNIDNKGEGHIIISSSSLSSGYYLYSLIIDNRIIDTKKFIVNK